jgi:hypothetical protein
MSFLNLNFLLIFLLFSCNGGIKYNSLDTEEQDAESTATINPTGEKLINRIAPPAGYTWEIAMPNSFAEFLQNLPLKEAGSPVLDYTGAPINNQEEHIAIINYDVGIKNLQQCADATIRLRAEYLFNQKRFDEIGFHFTSGDYFSWTDYANGTRSVINGNSVSFSQTASADDSYSSFRKYLDVVYNYAGTISVNKETSPVRSNAAISSGDVIITPGSPGHAVMIVGCAKDKQNNRVYLLAESYMPAQSIHVLKNPFESGISPWYHLDLNSAPIQTARYTFNEANIRRFE